MSVRGSGLLGVEVGLDALDLVGADSQLPMPASPGSNP